jgi:DNA-binding NtrC family response regulator
MIFRAMILSDGNHLRPSDFPQISGLIPKMAQIMEEEDKNPLDSLFPANESDELGAVSVLDREGHLRTLEDIERDLIAFAIETYHGHMSEVARRLGIGRSTLYRKVREHALDVDQVRSA